MELRQFLYLFEGLRDTGTGALLTKQGALSRHTRTQTND